MWFGFGCTKVVCTCVWAFVVIVFVAVALVGLAGGVLVLPLFEDALARLCVPVPEVPVFGGHGRRWTPSFPFTITTVFF